MGNKKFEQEAKQVIHLPPFSPSPLILKQKGTWICNLKLQEEGCHVQVVKQEMRNKGNKSSNRLKGTVISDCGLCK